MRVLVVSLFVTVTAAGLAGAQTPTPTASPATPPATSGADDLWLEEVTGEKALAWVRQRNAEAEKELASSPAFEALERDRVHPGHARRMMAKMLAMGHDVRYYENIEGGHGGAANNKQAAHMQALAYSFLATKLR